MYIKSLLETDFYEFLMQQIFVNKFSDVTGKLKFKCRNKVLPYNDFIAKLNDEIDNLCSLRFTDDEINYLANIKTKSGTYIFRKNGGSYLEFLRNFRLNREYVTIYPDNQSDALNIEIEGPIRYASIFEVYLLRIISFMNAPTDSPSYRRFHLQGLCDIQSAMGKLKIFNKDRENKLKFADFGTRRAFSRSYHQDVIKEIISDVPEYFAGTSNVYLAKKYNLTPIGTMAHKFVQMFQGLDTNSVDGSQKAAFQTWADFYRGDLGIALTDTLGNYKFFKDFDLYFAKLFDGGRHDSGDPYEWGEAMIMMYQKYGIDPKTKTLVFSDSLDFQTMMSIHEYFENRTNVSFGIGTSLTNHKLNGDPLNIVIKLIETNGKPVAKLSADSGKTMCENANYLDYLKMLCE